MAQGPVLGRTLHGGQFPTQLVRPLQGHLHISKTFSPTAINSLVFIGMAKVKPTFVRKQNQIPISMSEVQVKAAPFPFDDVG